MNGAFAVHRTAFSILWMHTQTEIGRAAAAYLRPSSDIKGASGLMVRTGERSESVFVHARMHEHFAVHESTADSWCWWTIARRPRIAGTIRLMQLHLHTEPLPPRPLSHFMTSYDWRDCTNLSVPLWGYEAALMGSMRAISSKRGNIRNVYRSHIAERSLT